MDALGLSAPTMLTVALGYTAASLLPATWHHARHWALMSQTMQGHGVWPRVLRLPAQLGAVMAQGVFGAAAGCLALAADDIHWSYTAGVLAGVLGLSGAFAVYVSVLRRRGVRVSCGCYFLEADQQASSASFVPSTALGVAAVVGLASLLVEPAEAAPPLLGKLLLVALGVALSILVQCLVLSHDRESKQLTSTVASFPVDLA